MNGEMKEEKKILFLITNSNCIEANMCHLFRINVNPCLHIRKAEELMRKRISHIFHICNCMYWGIDYLVKNHFVENHKVDPKFSG
jgi:hypothetical protein